MAYDGDAFQAFGGVEPGVGQGGSGIERVGLLLCDAGKESIFHRAGTLQAPAVTGYVFGDGLFDDADRSESRDEFVAELLKGAFFAGKAGVSAAAQAVN